MYQRLFIETISFAASNISMNSKFLQIEPPIVHIKKVIGFFLLLSISGLFLLSGISKIFSLESFTWSFIDLGISNFTLAGVFARLLIGFEIVLAILLLLHFRLKKITYPLICILLTVFTIYLLILYMNGNKDGNCGCFGDWIYMNPLQSIYKNLAMIAVTVYLWFTYPGYNFKNQMMIALLAGFLTFAVPFIMDPVAVGTDPLVVKKEIPLELLYKYDHQPKVDLTKGKHIIAFMSLTCPHCRKAAYLLHIIKEQHPELPIYLVLAGNPINQSQFFEETQARNLPFVLYRHPDDFLEMAGDGVPYIVWVNNGVGERESNYYQLDPKNMKAWLEQK